jgi:hypothetical protein
MIRLPHGCTINYPIVIEVRKMSREIVDWYQLVGGTVYKDEHYDNKGRKVCRDYVQYGNGKYCHHRVDGTTGVRLHFNKEDAKIATMFILQFPEDVETHNIEGIHFE